MGTSKAVGTSGVTFQDILDARAAVTARAGETPLSLSKQLSSLTGQPVYIKWDNRFQTGSFKERGVVNFLAQLEKLSVKPRGVCTASAGNHALALSYHASQYGIPCAIVMPVHAPLVKSARTQATGAEVILAGDSFEKAYQIAQELSQERNYMFVPGFDHRWIVAGAGTAGLSVYESIPKLDTVVLPIGGGGLAAGVALALKNLNAKVRVVGVQSEWKRSGGTSSSRANAFTFPSLADGIAVKQPSPVTAPLIQAYVDEIVTVSEDEIADGIIAYLNYEHTVIEGAGAAALAALLAKKISCATDQETRSKESICVFACGSNIDPGLLSRLIERDLAHRERICRFAVSVPDRPGSLHKLTGILSSIGANVIEVQHDRSFGEPPGAVEIACTVEVRDAAHKNALLEMLSSMGLHPIIR